MERAVALALCLCLVMASPVLARGTLMGSDRYYEIQPGDRVDTIAKRFGIPPQRIRQLNRLKRKVPLKAGSLLFLGSRHIIPEAIGAKLLVNIPDLMLYRFEADRPLAAYPVGLGQPFVESASGSPIRWQTPTGRYHVAELRPDPIWNVPLSIQEEMAAKGKPIVKRELPGPKNPLGKYWIGLSAWGYGIHGTNAPGSVGKFTTHGCIRMKPGDIDDVYAAVMLNDPVRLAYEPIKVAIEGSQIYMEVHQDVYRKHADLRTHAAKILGDHGVWDKVDPLRLSRALQDAWGLAVRIDRLPILTAMESTPVASGSGRVP